MESSYNMEQNLQQKTMISHEMQQSMKVLQMSSLELLAHIHEEFMENPVLELEQDGLDQPTFDDLDASSFIEYLETFNKKERNDVVDDYISPLEFISKEKTLVDHLMEQVHLLGLKEPLLNICEYIIYSLDERGYYTEDIELSSQILGVNNTLFREGLEVVRKLSPSGIGWGTLEECLIHQLIEKGLYSEEHKELIHTHLEKLATGHTMQIASIMGITEVNLEELILEIRQLEPKPSRGFPNNAPKGYIIPDIRIQKVNEHLEITMSTMRIPKLVISQEMKSLAKIKDNPETKTYLDNRIQRALMLMRTIQMRKNTVERITESLMEHQKDFILEKKDYLEPLSMKLIAEELEIHESTVSRAVRGKYACTPRGTLELKSLFSGSTRSNESEFSTSRIKDSIKDLIHAEDSNAPLSDQKIMEILNDKGISIKRRTVAKYRDELSFPTAKVRKLRFKIDLIP